MKPLHFRFFSCCWHDIIGYVKTEMAERVRYVPELQVSYEGDGDIVDEDEMDQLMSHFFCLEDVEREMML